MSEYIIMTDSCCDLPAGLADELGLVVLPLSVYADGNTYANWLDGRDISFPDYYQMLRDGKEAMTSAVSIGAFIEAMEAILKEGKDVLYLGFSSGLSATHSVGASAAAQLAPEYPERKIITVDTLSASLGQGLLVYLAVQQKNAGKSIEEVRDYVEENKLHLCHWFTVDDLNHLKRGGRVSASAALVGTALNIKPVMHMDNEGHLIPVSKVRGRKHAIKALAEKMAETAINPSEQIIFISHGDCEDEAVWLGDLIKEELGVKDVVINYVGPVIGTHSGPGTLALFFLGEQR